MIERPTTRTGLAAMTAGAAGDASGHLVLGDWLEEHLDRADLAALFRRTTADPRDDKERQQTRYSGFRYGFLDSEVMLCMAAWKVVRPYEAGKKAPEREGHLISLCVSAEAAGQLLRWVRWLPHDGKPDDDLLGLWGRMGEEVPKLPFEEKS